MLKLYEEAHDLRLVSCIIMLLEFSIAKKSLYGRNCTVDKVNLLINKKQKSLRPSDGR